MYFPSKEEFLKLSAQGNLIPVYREILGDLETPVSAYFKLSQGAKYSFLLESVEGEEKVARYSFLARDPELVFESKGRNAKITEFHDGQQKTHTKEITDSPLEFIREIMAGYKIVDIPGLPRFCGGMVGYIGYDVVRFFEKLPSKTHDDLKLPDIILALAKNLVIFDHRNHKIQVVACVAVDSNDSPETKSQEYEHALRTIDRTVGQINGALPSLPDGSSQNQKLDEHSNLTPDKFQNMVKTAKKHIKAGDIIQVVLSQRFEIPVKTDPFNVYRVLRTVNPSPYLYYLNFNDVKIAGSSPELLVRVEDGVVETRPIAGTRRRGKNEKEDAALAEDLLSDPKEKAEHIMLVDLGRNDLGRVCQRGSVQISEFMVVEKYSHVMHIVSNVKGKLLKNKDGFDVLKAAFPAGTVSGAPKIRAMEIIEDLEKVSRGPYAGAIGYFSFSGNLDTCITIRTIVMKDGKAYVQAGAGLVADSVPHKEFQETINKAKAQIMAIKMAHTIFN